MLPSPQLSLPPELTDRIIDHLYDDLDSLSACALVCSGWLPSARFHLFRHVTVTCRRLSKLRGVIIRRPEIGPYIRQIVVCCATPDCWTPRCTCLTRKDHTKLCDILTRLPKLHALRLRNMNVFAPPSNLESVEIVELDGVITVSSLPALHSWLSAFPRLKSFKVGNLFLDDTPSKWAGRLSALSRLIPFNPMVWLPFKGAAPLDLSHFPVSPTLSAAHIVWSRDGYLVETISEQLITHGVSRNLRRLSLQLDWGQPTLLPSAVFAFTHSLGPSLTHLEIGLALPLSWYSDWMSKQGYWGRLSFSLSCPNLKHIRFLDGQSTQNLSTWVRSFLSNLRCPRVATMCFAVTVGSYLSGWVDLVDELLSVANMSFGKLTRVVFELSYIPCPCKREHSLLVDPLQVCDRIAKGWRNHRRAGIVYEVVLNDADDGERPYIRWEEKDEEGIPKRMRVLMTSRDGEDTPRR
ncbi:hypothetical protein LXA43DRAFT_1029574 [Ganoderma leucocontextum]|nr:hypothetical protein LXA43DRAFT_1029574 [Ganoderma leucocontextum]